MTGLGLPIFDKAIQDANSWLNDIMYELDWEDKHRAFTLLRSTLHILRDRLHANENAHFAAQLPTLIRGVFYEGYQPAKYSANIRHRGQFVEAVMAAFGDSQALVLKGNEQADPLGQGAAFSIKGAGRRIAGSRRIASQTGKPGGFRQVF